MELTFKLTDDRLERTNIIKKVQKYIEIIDTRRESHAISMAINSKWGGGKTCLLSMWIEYIKKTNTKDRVVYYNAWENDDCDSAILPLLYHIISTATDETESEEKYIDNVKYFFMQLGFNTVKFGVDKVFSNYPDIGSIINNSFQSTIDKEGLKNIFTEYDDYYGKRKKLQNTLKELIPTDGNLWVFIDDLDRCNPSFSINTLECIKHFFDIHNIYFIFAIDYDQLAASVQDRYGIKIDASSYIKKFFDGIYTLPAHRIDKYVKAKLDDVYKKSKLSTVKKRIKKILIASELIPLFEFFDYSLRDMDLTISHLEFFALTQGNKLESIDLAGLRIYYYFMCLKDKHNLLYSDIIHGRFSMETESIWRCIDERIIYDETIRELLIKISKKSAEKPAADLFDSYHLLTCYPKYNTFADHMENILC